MRLLHPSYRFRLLLMVLVLVIIGMPVIAELADFDTTPVGLTIIVIGVITASGRRTCPKILVPAFSVLALVWVCTIYPDGGLVGFHYLGVSALLLLSTSLSIIYLRQCREIDSEALSAAAAVYLLFGLACGGIYAAISIWVPGGLEFTGLDKDPGIHEHTYFSFVVLTTIGFGDVVPRDALNRSMAMLEGIAGLFYLAIVISRLVSLYHQGSGSRDTTNSIK